MERGRELGVAISGKTELASGISQAEKHVKLHQQALYPIPVWQSSGESDFVQDL